MIRLVFTVLCLLLSTVSNANQQTEMVTSPFVYEITSKSGIVFCDYKKIKPDASCFQSANQFYLSNVDTTPVTKEYTYYTSKISNFKYIDVENLSVLLKKLSPSNTSVTSKINYQYDYEEISKIPNSHNSKVTDKRQILVSIHYVNQMCKKGKSITIPLSRRPSTDEILLNDGGLCHNNCVANFHHDATLTLNKPFKNFKAGDIMPAVAATTTAQQCKLKPFKKTSSDNPCPYNLRYVKGKGCKSPPDKTKCPKDEIYNARVDKCVVNTIKRNKPPTANNPKPDNSKPDDQKCPDKYFYHQQTHQCLEKDDTDTSNTDSPSDGNNNNDGSNNNNNGTGNNDCSQVEKDKNGGKCPTKTDGKGDGKGDGEEGKGDLCKRMDVVCKLAEWFQDEKDMPKDYEGKNKVDIQDSTNNTDWQNKANKKYINLGSSQCPASRFVDMNLNGQTQKIELPFAPFCHFASMIKPAIIFSAWIAALFIVQGGRRRE